MDTPELRSESWLFPVISRSSLQKPVSRQKKENRDRAKLQNMVDLFRFPGPMFFEKIAERDKGA